MKLRQTHSRPIGRRTAHGFVLLEALVAFLILSIGILGVIGLQATMAKAGTASKARADAAYLAQHVIGTAWSDRDNLTKYDSASCATHAPCAEWQAKVEAMLPAGATVLALDAATGDLQVTLTWTSPNEPTHTFQTFTTITP